jgi:hypothetical protein
VLLTQNMADGFAPGRAVFPIVRLGASRWTELNTGSVVNAPPCLANRIFRVVHRRRIPGHGSAATAG